MSKVSVTAGGAYQRMAEYIEREAVMQKFADHVKRSNTSDFAPVPTWNQAVQIVEDSPAADVLPVVLCRDCKHYRLDPIEIGQMVCVKDADEVDGYFSGFLSCPPEDWFCADGEKREEN